MSVIKHKTYTSLYSDMNSDPMGMNDDASKAEKIAQYSTHWRTDDGPPTIVELKQTVTDHFADHNPGGIVMWVAGPGGIPVLKAMVGLKKYTSDPSCMSSLLFGHHYGLLGDVEDGSGEIIKFDWDVLQPSPDVNVYKEKHHKKKLEDDTSIILMPPVKDADAQHETISVRNAMFVPYCLMQYVLDKDLNPREAFLLLFDIITASKLTGC